MPTTIITGTISGITSMSGGTQLPNIPSSKGVTLFIPTTHYDGFEEGPFVVVNTNNNPPYFDDTFNPTTNSPDMGTFNTGAGLHVTNLNQIRVLIWGGSGAVMLSGSPTIGYIALD